MGWVPNDRAAVCEYGDKVGAEANCKVIVPAGQGVREGGTVFCSRDHAARDQQECPL